MIRFAAPLCLLLLSSLPSHAVIVAGGLDNSTESGLNNYLTSTNHSSFPYWNNLVRVADASGVYLGYNPTTNHGWVLSANHVSHPSSITVDGTSHQVLSTHTFTADNSDLCLYELGGSPNTNLPSVPLASTPANSGDFALMFGRGFSNSSSEPYVWGTPGTSDSITTRWGTNTILYNVSGHLFTDFDAPALDVDPYEAQASLGDSGGGLFIEHNGVWTLYGTAHYVSGSGAATYGSTSGYSRVLPEVYNIESITGALIPEPSSSILFSLASLVLLRRRR